MRQQRLAGKTPTGAALNGDILRKLIASGHVLWLGDDRGSSQREPAHQRIPRIVGRIAEIELDPPDKVDFLHAVLCQVGMPRRKVEGRSFTRTSGAVSIKIDAGELWDGRAWRAQPLPYGTRPRLVMVHISSQAVRKQSREIEIGHSIRGFLEELGIGTSGGRTGPFAALKNQMMALAACRMAIGMTAGARIATIDAKPIEKFEAWMHPTGAQRTIWPGTLVLSQRFYETLIAQAVPLDNRALSVLKHSALALDTYTWLAHRLCRINRAAGVKVSWANLQDQFGQEYADRKDFKKEFSRAMRLALVVYPAARVSDEAGGIRLYSSPPPVPKTQILTPPRD